MYCTNCGKENENNALHCVHCGAALEVEQAPVQEPISVEPATPAIPEEYSPLSPWAYFGLSLLFSIPVVGFIFLIIFSCKKSNINRRNYALSYWIALAIGAGILILMLIFLGIMGFGLYEVIEETMYY